MGRSLVRQMFAASVVLTLAVSTAAASAHGARGTAAQWRAKTLPVAARGPAVLAADSVSDVSCVTSTDCVAVGNYGSSSATASTPYPFARCGPDTVPSSLRK